ncbi:MAG: NAD(+) diphosphatase [Ilumatobacteraceae bacterium]
MARTHKFCGRCATPTEKQANDRSMKCPACGLLRVPTSRAGDDHPGHRGEGDDSEALLARGVQFRAPMYSCLAGFVEPGESLEQSVIREVREEVGVVIGTPRYMGSQPWPFPHSLMIGFRAEWLGGDIVCDPTEIVDAQWFRKDALPNIPPHLDRPQADRRLAHRGLSPRCFWSRIFTLSERMRDQKRTDPVMERHARDGTQSVHVIAGRPPAASGQRPVRRARRVRRLGHRWRATDAHQEEAALALASGDHVVLATPTGSGKSLVAMAGIVLARNLGQRAVWTAPIKALVAEKFFDLVDLLGAEEVGLATGDAAINAERRCWCAPQRCSPTTP